jgi:hypothetical protein
MANGSREVTLRIGAGACSRLESLALLAVLIASCMFVFVASGAVNTTSYRRQKMHWICVGSCSNCLSACKDIIRQSYSARSVETWLKRIRLNLG